MDSVSVYSRGDEYFLHEDIGGYLYRTPLCKGRYKGTLEPSSYSASSHTEYSLDQCTLHPEYCNVAWRQLESSNFDDYGLIIYDKGVVTDRFLSKALTSMEDIQKAILMGYKLWFENLLTIIVLDNKTRHIRTSETYNLYKGLLEG